VFKRLGDDFSGALAGDLTDILLGLHKLKLIIMTVNAKENFINLPCIFGKFDFQLERGLRSPVGAS
jgi:hypothetical protein